LQPHNGHESSWGCPAFNLPVGNGDQFDLHLDAPVPNGWRAEFHVNDWLTWKVLCKEVPEPVGGWVTLSEGLGLGLELKEGAVKEYRAR
jgi:L-alanine-DL-glutamate epimerase-like enolase superfamily enzyme